MNRPWKVWLWFALCLAVVIPAMGWLTQKALELDLAVTKASREADLEEEISLALWRMDAALAPIVAQEAARPYLVYRPFLGDPLAAGGKDTGGKGIEQTSQVSPLLVQPSEFVRLHFELDDKGNLTSPQCPAGDLRELAVHNGTPLDNIKLSCDSLAQLSETIQPKQLAAQLPQQNLPSFSETQLAWDSRQKLWNFNENQLEGNQQVVKQNDEQLDQYYGALPNQQPGVPQPQPNNSPDGNQVGRLDPPRQQVNPQMAGPQQQELEQQQSRATEDYEGQYAGNFYGYTRNSRSQAQRGMVEFDRRNKALQTYATTEVVKQRKNLPVVPAPHAVEGVSAPLWMGSQLLLARRVNIDDHQVVQGCWFDWPKLKNFLISQGADVGSVAAATALPAFDLQPISGSREVSPARRLASLPVEIVVPAPPVKAAAFSPIRLSLLVAWGCMALATGAVALLLAGVVTLSERRGAFVSAVTHELRTPLTTFRMYAEMLSEGMVKDPQQQQQYTETLRVEANRLSHLVENVLSYARLERGRKGGRREDISVEALLDRVHSRLADRAGHAGMELCIEADDAALREVANTDPQAVEQILFNLVDNACKYAQLASDRTIHLSAAISPQGIVLRVRDHGPGITKAFARRLFQPFSKSVEDAAVTAPGVGLGLALCRRLASELGGSLELEGGVGDGNGGCTFRLMLPRST